MLSVDADDFSVELKPVEDLSGGGSRTCHVILKRPYASLSMSAFSCSVHGKMAPNRDYPYEGLCCLAGGDQWKFIDAVGLGIMVKDRPATLEPVSVRASPWDVEYTYEADGLTARVRYYLFDAPGCAGIMHVRLDGSDAGRATIVLEPFFDIRFMYDPSVPGEHEARIVSDTLAVSVNNNTACISAPGARYVPGGRQVLWGYKLGSGNRCRQDGRLKFVPEERTVSSFYEIAVDRPEATLTFACGASQAAAMGLLEGRYRSDDLSRALAIKQALFGGNVPVRREALFRALGMDRFGMPVDGVMFREAGDFWFRSIWFRDEFEGMMHNYQSIKRIDGTANMKEALLKSFELQDDRGRIPNRLVPGTGRRMPDYNSVDATLLAFILAGMVVRDTGDSPLAVAAAASFRKFVNGLRRCELEENGPPRVRPNGLISVPAWHSWTDGMRTVDGRLLPIRVSREWERELIGKGAERELFQQKFFLPEINAQWMRALEAGWLFSRYDRDFALADACKGYYNRALASYKPVFVDPASGYLNNLVSTEDFALGPRADPTPGSPGVVAAAMLGLDVFTLRELEGIAAFARARLMRAKWGLPFGIIVKEGPGEYLGDAEYHEAVVWPRDTPYLIRLLEITGDKMTIDGLLASNLRHQMEEGFVFYNAELFSDDHDLVPVKNPVQWWSQWVDPYLGRPAP
jgi:hypothetical protein